MQKKGLICCDIDGTLVGDDSILSKGVVQYLHKVSSEGWCILFVTGRSYFWAKDLFADCDFPFYLAIFNGALMYSMPDEKIVQSTFLDRSAIDTVFSAVKGSFSAIACYYGPDQENRSFLFAKNASKALLEQLEKRKTRLQERWQESTLSALPQKGLLAIRCFLSEENIEQISQSIERDRKLHAPKMRDASHQGSFLVQVTDKEATKKQAMHKIAALLDNPVCIACGDDYNDISMLEAADIAIVMQTAPKQVKAYADILAPPVSEEGAITALKQVLQYSNKL